MINKHTEKKLLTVFVVFVFSLLYNLKYRHLSPLPPALLYAFLEGEDNCRGEDINLLGFFFSSHVVSDSNIRYLHSCPAPLGGSTVCLVGQEARAELIKALLFCQEILLPWHDAKSDHTCSNLAQVREQLDACAIYAHWVS